MPPFGRAACREAVIGGCSLGRCMNSRGLITRCVVLSRHGVLSFNFTCPAAFSCTRSSGSAGGVM
jgi:hypothetical protein